MGEIFLLTKPLNQLNDALLAADGVITLLLKNLGGSPIGQIGRQLSGTVYVDQRLVSREAEGKDPQPLGVQLAVI